MLRSGGKPECGICPIRYEPDTGPATEVNRCSNYDTMAEHSERPTFTEEDERVYDVAEPEPEDELGGRVEDEEPEHPSVLMSLVRSLMPGQELSRVTIPSWFLESRSLLEKFTDTMMHPQLLLRCVTAPATPDSHVSLPHRHGGTLDACLCLAGFPSLTTRLRG